MTLSEQAVASEIWIVLETAINSVGKYRENFSKASGWVKRFFKHPRIGHL